MKKNLKEKELILKKLLILSIFLLNGCFLLPKLTSYKAPPLSKRYVKIESRGAYYINFNIPIKDYKGDYIDSNYLYMKDTLINLPDTGKVCISVQADYSDPLEAPYLKITFMPDSISKENTMFYGKIEEFCNE